MINDLEKRGLLQNTIIIITSDNGMPFPRSKGFSFEISNHMPMAVMWKNGIKVPGTTVSNYYSTLDIAATLLDVSQTSQQRSGMAPLSGRSLRDVFKNPQKGNSPTAEGVLYFGRERNDFGRPENQGYPSRSVMKDGFLYIVNLKSDRYPAGNPETGYLDTDGSPSKTVILNLRRTGKDKRYWRESFGLRPEEEFDRYPFMTADYWNFWERVRRKEIKDPASKTGWVEPGDYEPTSDSSSNNFKP
jgi:arylsulfatase A-like enzyme